MVSAAVTCRRRRRRRPIVVIVQVVLVRELRAAANGEHEQQQEPQTRDRHGSGKTGRQHARRLSPHTNTTNRDPTDDSLGPVLPSHHHVTESFAKPLRAARRCGAATVAPASHCAAPSSSLPKPFGLPLIHRHESAHMASMPSSAFHPSC